MRAQKLYAGVKLREVRTGLSLTQKDFAGRLGVSLSYLNQMENNHRPLSAGVLLALAREYDFDVTALSVGEADRMVADMREALADPVFPGTPPTEELQLVAANAPTLARAFLALHRAHRQGAEQLATLNEALGTEGSALTPLPWEEVRDFFHYCDNYIDPVDRAAERFASTLAPGDPRAAMAARLEADLGVSVATDFGAPLRQYDPARNRLTLAAEAGIPTQ
ncbi:MAG: helix-turn-helix domain-containing protein, partial [Pseudomonadota bacterium]